MHYNDANDAQGANDARGARDEVPEAVRRMLDWWEAVRLGLVGPAGFAGAVARLTAGELAAMVGLVAQAREAGLLDAPAELNDVGTALVALAIAMLPPGDRCSMTAEIIAELLNGGAPTMRVPLYLGDKLRIRDGDGLARSYFPPTLHGLRDLTLTYTGDQRLLLPFALPQLLNVLVVSSRGSLVLNAPDTVARKLECVEVEVVAIGAPTEELRLIRCEGAGLPQLVRDAAGAAVKVECGFNGRAAGLELDLDGCWYPSLSLARVAVVRGDVRVNRLYLLGTRVGGRLSAREATVRDVTGEGRIEAGAVIFGGYMRRPEAGALLVTPAADRDAPAGGAPRIVSDRWYGLHEGAAVRGAPAEVQWALSSAGGGVWGGRTEVRGASCWSASELVRLLAGGKGGPASVLRASLVGGDKCPAAEIKALVLAPLGGLDPVADLGDLVRTVRVGLLVVRGGPLTYDWFANAVGAWPNGAGLVADRLLAVAPDGAEDEAAGERLAALLGAVRVGLEAAEADGVPASWLSAPFVL